MTNVKLKNFQQNQWLLFSFLVLEFQTGSKSRLHLQTGIYMYVSKCRCTHVLIFKAPDTVSGDLRKSVGGVMQNTAHSEEDI